MTNNNQYIDSLMKRFIAILGMAAAIGASSCQRETEPISAPPEQDPAVGTLRYREFPVTIGEEAEGDGAGMRSLVTINAEDFKEAYLYAFDATTKEILMYPDDGSAGDHRRTPVTRYTRERTFNWALPVDTPMDIRVIVNPGDIEYDYGGFEDTLTDSNMCEEYLEDMTYYCRTTAEFIRIESNGMPMTGRLDDVTLDDYDDAVTINAKRLFAKYTFSLSVASEFAALGYQVSGVYLMGGRTNTVRPLFSERFAQTDPNRLSSLDRATPLDLTALNANGEVTLYFLENCQGDKNGARSWTTVDEDLGDAVSLCTYVDLGVRFLRPETDHSFREDIITPYRIYLGKTDMRSNFDVEGNYYKHVTLSLSDVAGRFFFRTPVNPIVLAPNESVFLPFVWTGFDACRFTSSDPEMAGIPTDTFHSSASFGPATYNNQEFLYSGAVTVRTYPGSSGEVAITGGDLLSENVVSDTRRIVFRDRSGEYFTFDTHNATVSPGGHAVFGFSASASSLDYLLLFCSAPGAGVDNIDYNPFTHRGSFRLSVTPDTPSGFQFSVYGANFDGPLTMDQINVTVSDSPTFSWNEHQLSVTPGSSYTLEFTTNATDESDLEVVCSSPYLSFDNLFFNPSDGTGEISFDVLPNAPYTLAGNPIIVTGYHNGASVASDVCEVTIAQPVIPLSIRWEIVNYPGGYSDDPPALLFETVGDNTFNGSVGFCFKVRLKEDRYAGGDYVPVPPDFEVYLTNLPEGGVGADDYVFYYNQVGTVNVTFRNGQAILPFSWDARMISGISTKQFDQYHLEVQYHGVLPDPYGGYTIISVTPGLGDNPLTWDR